MTRPIISIPPALKKPQFSGFTLIEVLVSLAIIAIALTAIIKATSTNISNTTRVKSKAISHMVQMNAVSMLQLNLIPISGQTINQSTVMFHQKWYWKARVLPTPSYHIKQLLITISDKPTGPFLQPLTAYYYS